MKRSRGTRPAALLLCCLSWVASGASAGDGVVALQTADPSCGDDSGNRYVNCNNGTVTDNDTGLVWLRNANCIGSAEGSTATGEVDWYQAMEFVAGLSDLPDSSAGDDCGLSDGSSPGEWRLPSVAEFEAMVAEADALGCSPTITDNQGDGCWAEPFLCVANEKTCSFTGVQSAEYWASSPSFIAGPQAAWAADLDNGEVLIDNKVISFYAWPVRGGQ